MKKGSLKGSLGDKLVNVWKNTIPLKLLKNLLNTNKSIIFTAHEKEEKVNDQIIKRPDIVGSSGKDIVKDLDFMGYMSINGGRRTIDLNPNDETRTL